MDESKIDRLFSKLDQIETKLDNHLERLSKAEEAIMWLKLHVKVVTTVVTAALLGVGGIFTSFIISK